MKKLACLAILFGLLHLPISCYVDDCGGFEPEGSRVTELAVSLSTLNDLSVSQLPTTDFRRVQILVMVEEVETFRLAQRFEKYLGNPFLNSALACSPPLPEPSQEISSIRVSMSEPIYSGGMEYAAGQDLITLFQVSNQWEENRSVNQFIIDQNQDTWEFGTWDDQLAFSLLEEPDSSLNGEINLSFTFDDNTSFNLTLEDFQVLVETD